MELEEGLALSSLGFVFYRVRWVSVSMVSPVCQDREFRLSSCNW